MKLKSITPVFVEEMPDELKKGEIYISMIYETSKHLCACGCGEVAVIPFSLDNWSLLFRNGTVTIRPSMQHRFKCKSHYTITENRIDWL